MAKTDLWRVNHGQRAERSAAAANRGRPPHGANEENTMKTQQATVRKPLNNRMLRTECEGETVSIVEDTEALALQMTEDFGRSRRYWLCALTTEEDR